MKVTAAVHGVCEIASLETWCLKCHSPHRAHVCTQQEGPTVGLGSDLGGGDLSVSTSASSCRLSLTVSLFVLLLYLIFLSVSNTVPLSLPFPSCFSLAHSFILTSHSTLLCPCYHGYCLLQMRWGFTRTDGRYRNLWYSCLSSMSFFLSFWIFFLTFTFKLAWQTLST